MTKENRIRELKIEIEQLTRTLRKHRDEILLVSGEIKAMERRLHITPCCKCKKYINVPKECEHFHDTEVVCDTCLEKVKGIHDEISHCELDAEQT